MEFYLSTENTTVYVLKINIQVCYLELFSILLIIYTYRQDSLKHHCYWYLQNSVTYATVEILY